MRRILKPTGSLYFHCDFDANSYVRLALDAVFGQQNVRNEIIWERHTSSQRGSQHMPRRWGRIIDTILFCTKSPRPNFNPFVPPSDAEAARRFPLVDENGERYYDDSAHIWSTPRMGARPNLCYEWRGFTNPHPSGWRLSRERLEEEYQKGNFVILPDGRLQRRMYQRDWRGTVRGNLWNDVRPALGGERTGYPTQKPVALAERIILASTRPGDVVLDCFAGCAYVPVAAERNGRQWIACDISPRALTVLKRQFAKFRYAVDGVPQGQSPALITDANVITRSPFDLPERTDPGRTAGHCGTARKNLQSSRQHHPGKGNAGVSAGAVGLHRLVLRLRQSPARRQHHQNYPQLSSGSSGPEIVAGQQPDLQPRADVPAS